MNLQERRANHFAEFKSNQRSLYVLSGKSRDARHPSFTVRKLDQGHLAILAWMDRAEAEKWRLAAKLNDSKVIELKLNELEAFLSKLGADERDAYRIELL